MNETVSMEVGVTPPYNFYLNGLVHRKKYPKIKLNFYLFQYKQEIITKKHCSTSIQSFYYVILY